MAVSFRQPALFCFFVWYNVISCSRNCHDAHPLHPLFLSPFLKKYSSNEQKEKKIHTIPLLRLTCKLSKTVQFCKFSWLRNTTTFSRADSHVKMWRFFRRFGNQHSPHLQGDAGGSVAPKLMTVVLPNHQQHPEVEGVNIRNVGETSHLDASVCPRNFH